MKLSIIFPMYNESENVSELFSRIYKTVNNLKFTIEILAINNGSYDDTLIELKKIMKFSKYKNWEINTISFSRNFGYDNALLSGLEHSSGNYVFIMDGDLQDPPEEIPRFLNKIQEGYEIVYGLRRKRTETFIIKFFIKIFYYLWNKLTKENFPKDAGNFCVMSKKVVNEINKINETNKYFRGIRAWVGFRSTGLEYQRVDRSFGTSKFSFMTYLFYGVEGITAFSTTPLRLLTIFGIIGLLISIISGSVIFTVKVLSIYFPATVAYNIATGWTTLSLLILLSISINFLGLGILGEYIGKIYDETKMRPKYIIDKIEKNF